MLGGGAIRVAGVEASRLVEAPWMGWVGLGSFFVWHVSVQGNLTYLTLQQWHHASQFSVEAQARTPPQYRRRQRQRHSLSLV